MENASIFLMISGSIVLLFALFGHHHVERGAELLGDSQPAMSKGTAIVVGIFIFLCGLVSFL